VIFYRFVRAVLVGLAHLLFGLEVRGAEKLPDGVYILAPTHRSLLDIPFAAGVTARPMRFMAKKELFEKPFWHWVFNELRAVSVDRQGTDRAALRAIEAALHDGENPVVIFPEGTRYAGRELGPLQSGAAYVALRTGVPLVPVGIGGSEHPFLRYAGIPWFSRVCVVVGEPMVTPRADGTVKRSLIAATDRELRVRMQACFDEAREWSATRTGRSGREPGQRV
jgi:1-acyl-sn-glycerol-3-phosphate acyltransferase